MEQGSSLGRDWEQRVLALRHRSTEAEDLEYVGLIDQARGRFDAPTLRTLLQTFTDEPDYGVQESVMEVLAWPPSQVLVPILLDELPRLLSEAPSWVPVLVGRQVMESPRLLVATAKHRDSRLRRILAEVVGNRQFLATYDEASQVLGELRAE